MYEPMPLLDRVKLMEVHRAKGRLLEDLFEHVYRQTLKPGGCFIDVGAHVGHHAFKMAECVGSEGRGLAIEPVRHSADTLRAGIVGRQLSQVTVAENLLADVAGPRMFYAHGDFPTWSSIYADNAHPNETKEPTASEMQATTIDQLIEEHDFKTLDFIKIDARQAEFLVLKGAKQTLKNKRPIVAFENALPRAAKTNGYEIADVFEFMNDCNYRVFDIFGEESSAQTWSRHLPRPPYYLAIPDEKLGEDGAVGLFDLRNAGEAIAKSVGGDDIETSEIVRLMLEQGAAEGGGRDLDLTSKGGMNFSIHVPPPNDRPSVFMMSVHKAGSTLLDRLTTGICRAADLRSIAVEPETFRQGVLIRDWPNSLYALFERDGYVFHGFRALCDLQRVEKFNKSKRVLLVRNPLDMTTSFYFSIRQSHVVPDTGETRATQLAQRHLANQVDIDQFVRDHRADGLFVSLQRYADYMDANPGMVLFRYEDIIFKKREWIAQLAEIMDVDLDIDVLNAIADENDIRPDAENPDKHVRQVTPGNFTKHLAPESIALLRERFSDVFEYYNYADDA